MKRVLCYFLSLIEVLMFTAIFTTSASASDVIRLDLSNGSIVIAATSSGTKFTQGGTVYQNTDGVAIIHQSNSENAIGNTISVNSGSAHLYVNDLNINATDAISAINIASGASLTLTIAGENTFRGKSAFANTSGAGIHVPPNASLHIDGTGSINSYGIGYSAGIGGGYEESCGSITINGGTVNATAGSFAAAIGGGGSSTSGKAGTGGTITINDGNVTATVSIYNPYGAGIGGGYGADGGTIIINGGTVHADVEGGGAGIGGGAYGGNGGIITITNGMVVTTTDGSGGAGIGGGYGNSANIGGSGGTITICGGDVTASSGGSAGIGGGCGANAGTILISGGSINAHGGSGEDTYAKETYGCAGIGSGGNGTGGTITITDGEITVLGAGCAAGIGGGTNANIGIITVEDGTIIASGGDGQINKTYVASGGAGIGGGYKSFGGVITIKGGDITANGGGVYGSVNTGSYGSGIGSGGSGSCDSIAIQGGLIHAKGAMLNRFGVYYECGAGLDATDINIESGEVYAEGGYGSPGIQGQTIVLHEGTIETVGGSSGAGIHGDEIMILGGDVTARGGSNGAGIGGNSRQAGGHIEIVGGTVSAAGGSLASGIGGGGYYKGDAGDIIIRGGNINAVSGDGASAIGGGGCSAYGTPGNGGTVEISGSAYVVAEGYYHGIGGGSQENDYGCFSLTIADTAVVIPSQKQTAINASVSFTNFQERITFESTLPDATAVSDHDVQFTTSAIGHSGVTYKWQESVDGNLWTPISGQTDEIAIITVDEDSDGHCFRCEITNGWGNIVYTDSASVTVIYFTQ